MTNKNKSDFKSYYPRINVTDYLSEREKKMLHDSMVREHEYAEALRREAAVKYCKLWFPLNPNFGITEKQKIMMRKLSEGEIIVLGMFATIITTLTLVPIMSGVNPILVLLLNGIWLLAYAFYAAAIVEDNKEHNERTFANVLYPFTATVGITFIMPALLISLH